PASYGTTREKRYEDRAAYQAGAPLRLADIRRTSATGPDFLADITAQDLGAVSASQVFRGEASYGPTFGRTDFHLLGVNPASFQKVAFFRGDFAGQSLHGLLGRIAKDAPPAPGVLLPEDARW